MEHKLNCMLSKRKILIVKSHMWPCPCLLYDNAIPMFPLGLRKFQCFKKNNFYCMYIWCFVLFTKLGDISTYSSVIQFPEHI